MNQERSAISRRGFLRGLGASVVLPGFQSLLPARAAELGAAARAVTASGAPLRMGFLYVPNGVNLERWRPEGAGADYQSGASAKVLDPLREHFQVVSGFEHANATAGGDGAGDHARSVSAFLTGIRPKKTAGSDISLGVSVDQLAARRLEGQTRFSSLELSCDGVRKSGSCDSGYSCAYQFNVSWRSKTQPMTPESNPRLVFERLFGSGKRAEREASLAQRRNDQRSILDFVLEDAHRMQKVLGRNDRMKLDEYLTGVREVERRIEMAESFGPAPDPGVPAPEGGIPRSYEEHIRLMFDMLLLAFQTDSTRVATYMLAHDGSNRTFGSIGVPDGHHNLSHHDRKEEKLEKIAKIDEFYLAQLAYFLERMRDTEDLDGQSLLHNSMLVWGGAIADGDRHSHSDLPIIVAGHGGGRFHPGRHLDLGRDVPMTNLYVRMLHEMGLPEERFGDSTGVLKEI